MTDEELARLVTASIARHQTRGLVYHEAATDEVVIHGRIDMQAVAVEIMAHFTARCALPSWAPWFGRAVHRRRGEARARLARQARLDAAAVDVEAAIERLRLRTDPEGADGPAEAE